MPPFSQSIVKEHHNHRLFRSEPPAGEDVKTLFKGRTEELARSLAQLRYNLDERANAENADDFFGTDETKDLWIIHGPTRSGKSHLGRRILADFPEDTAHRKLFFPCRDRLEPTEVFQRIFEGICTIFHECVALKEERPDAKNDSLQKTLIDETRNLILNIAPFCTPNPPDTVTIEYAQEHIDSLRAEFRGGIPAIIQFMLQAGTQTGSGTTYKATFFAPSAKQCSKYCGVIIDTLVRTHLLDHLLILVDDADLLENEYKTTERVQLKTVHLADALVELHQCRGVDILVTSRSHYAISKKEFRELIDLTGYGMDTRDLIDIYRAHVQKFGWKDHPEGFLTDEALEKAARWAAHLPGIFLMHLSVALEAFKREDLWTLRDGDWYRDTFKRYYDLYRESHRISELLEQAIKEGKWEIHFPKEKPYPFYGTKLDNIFIMPSFHEETQCKILPIAFELSGNKT